MNSFSFSRRVRSNCTQSVCRDESSCFFQMNPALSGTIGVMSNLSYNGRNLDLGASVLAVLFIQSRNLSSLAKRRIAVHEDDDDEVNEIQHSPGDDTDIFAVYVIVMVTKAKAA